MFSKQTAKGGATVENLPAVHDGGRRHSAPKVASLISADIAIKGNLSGGGDLHLDGTIKGDVKVERLTIGETGHVQGSITAETVDVRGRVSGAITAKQVRLFSTAHVDGDITHEQLSMEIGAYFQGRSLKLQRPAPAAAPQPEADVVALPAAE
ncbi:polymer-forming cytoskeletal protein [Caulobacter segnis]|jgi:cytoskeletal protein CcmA (bactofilin family)|uniref:bactofilin family protein n=1 Tax=Caulobacter segnis TaxID=88688 RepID=UPI00240EAAF9|nr:polymer-forming cytoskeletal protein [Caulobacter segnis]MDG2522314.1 polymer-forming cytoskeletal protein [Caulobacter segnis]